MVVLGARGSRNTLAFGTDWVGIHRPDVDVDIVGAVDGLMVVGEVKFGTAVVRRQLNGLVAIARRIQARQLVFATSHAASEPATDAMIHAVETDRNGFDVELIASVVEQARALTTT